MHTNMHRTALCKQAENREALQSVQRYAVRRMRLASRRRKQAARASRDSGHAARASNNVMHSVMHGTALCKQAEDRDSVAAIRSKANAVGEQTAEVMLLEVMRKSANDCRI